MYTEINELCPDVSVLHFTVAARIATRKIIRARYDK